jgi:putative colanic acid biosynthesis acetyltransferase WcaF
MMNLVFMKWWLPARFRPAILRCFGATIGNHVLIRHRVRILWPWKLSIGHNSWIGEGAWLLNLEPITIGDDVCISQNASLITGSHKYQSSAFEYDNGAIVIKDGAWLAFSATVARGVTINEQAVVGMAAIATRDLMSHHLLKRDGKTLGLSFDT